LKNAILYLYSTQEYIQKRGDRPSIASLLYSATTQERRTDYCIEKGGIGRLNKENERRIEPSLQR
jgi:hypothetical protein